jgi:integrase
MGWKRELSAKQVGDLGVGRHLVAPNLYLGRKPCEIEDPETGEVKPGVSEGSWLFLYRSPVTGRDIQMGLGAFAVLSVPKAKAKALELKVLLNQGRDPLAERRQAQVDRPYQAGSRALTFRQVTDRYLAAHEAGWKSHKHGAQWRSTLRAYAFPVFGDEPVARVDTSKVLAALEPIWATKNATAARVRSRIELVLDFAKANGWRQGENPAAWRAHLSKLLPPPSRVAPVEHHAAVPLVSLPALWAKLVAKTEPAALALQFAILTAARSNEVLGMLPAEVDGATWTCPAERMKLKKEHRVPLAPAALAVLARAEAQRSSDFQFSATRGSGKLGANSMLLVLNELVPGATVHGFRSSFRDWCGETRVDRELALAAIAHAVGDQSEAPYLRTRMLEARRPVMASWAAYVTGVTGSASVAAEETIIPLAAE